MKKNGRVFIICQYCGVKFNVIYYRRNAKYCSKKCMTLDRAIPKAACINCGTKFSPGLYHGRRQKYCCWDCLRQYQVEIKNKKVVENKRRVQTHSWKIIRKRIYSRDGNKCVICGSTFRLSAHHIIPWRISHDDSENNLISLCASCHHQVECQNLACPHPATG